MKLNLETLVLGALKDGPLHGYGIVRLIRGEGDVLKAGEGQMYPLLRALQDDGMVVSDWQPQQGRPPRKVYSLTDKGRTELARRRERVQKFNQAVERILGLGRHPGGEGETP